MAIPDQLKTDARKIAVDDVADTDAYWKNVFSRAANAVVESTDPTHQFRGGLGDQPSYREVHDLVVAWQPEKTILQHAEDGAIREVLQAAEWSTLTSVDEATARLIEAQNARALVAEAENLGTIIAEEGAPPEVKRRVPHLTDKMWRLLEPDDQQTLIRYAQAMDRVSAPAATTPEAVVSLQLGMRAGVTLLGLASRAIDIVAFVQAAAANPDNQPTENESANVVQNRLEDFLAGIEVFPYTDPIMDFDVFRFDEEPNNYVLGHIRTHRQIWVPFDYQPGELRATIPLLPGEERSYKVTENRKLSRIRKEAESAVSKNSFQNSVIVRSSQEVQTRASEKSNFSNSTNIGGKLGAFNINNTTELGGEILNRQDAVNKTMRESTKKAASEYRSERSLEVTTEEVDTIEIASSQSIKNPNLEITVTILFYELEQRFFVSETVEEPIPVILIPMPVPAPHEIDNAWVLRHGWILRRVLLDDQLLDAMDFLVDDYAGAEIKARLAKQHWEDQRDLVRDLGENVSGLLKSRGRMRKKLNDLATTLVPDGGILGGFVSDLVGAPTPGDVKDAQMEAISRQLEWLSEEINTAQEQLVGARDALEEAAGKSADAARELFAGVASLNYLRAHIKQNIFFYMQQIWSFEHEDQRFFRDYDRPIRMYFAEEIFETDFGPITLPAGERTVKLHEVADLDSLLGFKGNLAIYPLTKKGQKNPVTRIADNAMRPHWGLAEAPDDETETNLGMALAAPDADEQERVARKNTAENFKKALLGWGGLDFETPEGVSSSHSELVSRDDFYAKAFADVEADRAELIVIPTGEALVEALPGSKPLIENFMLRHRALDVASAIEELKSARLENVRRAGKIHDEQLGPLGNTRVVYVDHDLDNVNIEGPQ